MFIKEKATYVQRKKNDDKEAKIRHERKEQRMKKGSEPQREHLVLQNSQWRGTPLPPRR